MNQPEASKQILQQGMDLHRAGALDEAERLYAETLRLDPENARALRLRGSLARERGDIAASLRYLQNAMKLTPGDPEPVSELALTYMASGDLNAAEDNLRRCLKIDPNSARAGANLGAVLQQRGHTLAAIDCYRKTLSLEDDPYIRCNLAKALSDAGKFEAALDICSQTGDMSATALAATRGLILLDQQNYAEARDALLAIDHAKRDDMTLVNLALAEYQCGHYEAALKNLVEATELNPHNARASADLANCLCALDDAAAAIQSCESFLQRYPGERLVTGSYALALHNADRETEALQLTDCDRLVRVFECSAPKSIANTRTMNDMLTAELRNNPSRIENPVDKATTGGEQTGELDLRKSMGLQALQTFIRDSVNTMANELLDQGLGEHPVMAPAHGNQSIRAWGTLLKSGGRQSPHMHPLAWLSGVYYTHVPRDMNSADPQAGWLEFNRPPERFFTQASPRTWRYEPAEGRLILFPSWFWHHTLPFESADDRISIAFDIVPTDALRMF